MDKIKIPEHILKDLKKHSKEIDEDLNVLINRILKEWITINIIDFPIVSPKKKEIKKEEPKIVEEIKVEEKPIEENKDFDIYGED